MQGILITGGKCIGAIVSPDRPMDFFEKLRRWGLDTQAVTLDPKTAKGTIWVDTGADIVQARVVDSLKGESAQ